MKIIEREFNAETNQTIDIERTATAQEIADFESNQEAITTIQEAIKVKEIAKAALLDRLGITAEEAKLLSL